MIAPTEAPICLVTGGRDHDDRLAVWAALDQYRPTLLIQGGARGADKNAKAWAQRRNVTEIQMDAPWHAAGSRAGSLRNSRMLRVAQDLATVRDQKLLVLAFPGGRGTADMVEHAKARGVEVVEL